jgi:phosphohistidine phosphatase SixA
MVPEVDGVWSSPLARAWQTAEILEREAGWPAPRELAGLEPDADPAAILGLLRGGRDRARLALVGHEPGLHQILSLLLSGAADGVSLEMKKGGAALIRIDREIGAGAGQLLWLLPPRVVPGVED